MLMLVIRISMVVYSPFLLTEDKISLETEMSVFSLNKIASITELVFLLLKGLMLTY